MTTTAAAVTEERCDTFDELLAEAWCACADDRWLRESPSYGRLRKWLAAVSSTCPRGPAELTKLRCVVRALRACDETCLEELLRDERCPPAPPRRKRVRRKQPPGTVARTLRADDGAANCALLTALDAVDGCVGLQRFFREVAVHTCDRGELLARVTSEMLADFRTFVDNMFGNRASHIGMVLAREQMALRDRYAELEGRTVNRAQLALMHVRNVMPTFVWQRYATEDGYIKTVVASRCPDAALPDEPDADTDRCQSLLYQLNWLRSEIDRTECETRGLKRQHSAFVVQLAAINGDIASVQCRAANDMAAKVIELDALRAKSVEQVCTIDQLMEAINTSLRNAKSDSNASTTVATGRRAN